MAWASRTPGGPWAGASTAWMWMPRPRGHYRLQASRGRQSFIKASMPLKDGTIPAEDERWLPEHTQSLIYAQAMRRALGLKPAAALYFSTKGRAPAMRGAAAAALVGDKAEEGMIPGLRDGFPAAEHGGTMTFEQLLDRVEDAIAQRLDEMAHGVVCASEDPAGRCSFNHPSGFERRGA